jgi:hypothetical protein
VWRVDHESGIFEELEMTAGLKRKFLEAVDEIERQQGTDAPLSPRALLELLKLQFSALWSTLQEAFADEWARQLIAVHQGLAIRARRPHPEQLHLGLPNFGEVSLSTALYVPTPRKRADSQKGRWVKTLQAPLVDFERYLRHAKELAKVAGLKQRQKIAAQEKLYRAALSAAKGDKSMTLGEALSKLKGKRKVSGLPETLSLFE